MSTRRYEITGGQVEVVARSSIHDTRTAFGALSGTIDLDPEAPATAAAELALDMRVFDAGDRLKNWKLRSDLAPDEHPRATFRLARLDDVGGDGARLTGTAVGTLAWRGREVELRAPGEATVGADGLRARARFELDVRTLGVEPPRFFVFKIEPVAVVTVTLDARAIR